MHTNLTSAPWIGGQAPASTWPSWIYLDLLVIPLLLVLSALPFLSSSRKAAQSSPTQSEPASGYIIPAHVAHARFLPRESAHKFAYPALYLALRLDELEQHRVDAGHAFAWKGQALEEEWEPSLVSNRPVQGSDRWKARMLRTERLERRTRRERERKMAAPSWTLSGLHPEEYLRTSIPVLETPDAEQAAKWLQGSVLLKLAWELRDRGYLSVGPQDQLRGERLEKGVKSPRHWNQELGQVWSVAMPSLLGFRGINPLTVYFCYRPVDWQGGSPARANEHDAEVDGQDDDEEVSTHDAREQRGPFWLAVLEVHNTFTERHLYVLESSVNEDVESTSSTNGNSTAQRRGGYDHQWTFPRTFHVSPFNDRSGYYRLFLRELFPRDGESADGETGHLPHLDVRLLLMVEDTSSTESPAPLRKKLMASLSSFHPSTSRAPRALSSYALYATLARQPLDLFLTFPRILYEAARLHFVHRLDAYWRPDQVDINTSEEQRSVRGKAAKDFDGVGIPPPLNEPQSYQRSEGKRDQDIGNSSGDAEHAKADAPPNGAPRKDSGSLLWPAEGWTERVCRERVLVFARARVTSSVSASSLGAPLSLRIISTDPAVADVLIHPDPEHSSSSLPDRTRHLTLYTRSPLIYTDLALCPTPELALLLGSRIGRRWGVSDLALFLEFFQPVQGGNRHDSQSGSEAKTAPASWRESAARWLRARHLRWALTCADTERGADPLDAKQDNLSVLRSVAQLPSPDTRHLPELRTAELPAHALDTIPTASASAPRTNNTAPSTSFLLALFSLHIASVLEQALFRALGARYVQGTEPWLELRRGLELVRSERVADTDAGERGEKGLSGSALGNASRPWDPLGSVHRPRP